VGKAAKQPDVVVQIIVGKDEALSVKSQEQTTAVTLKDLVRTVKTAQGNAKAGKVDATTAVVISADKSVRYEAVVKVMDTLQRAGVQRVGLSVQLAGTAN